MDRLDDKRKFAANEIEKMTVELSRSNNLTMINRLIIVLGRKFCLSHHQNTRKGGLLGLAAVMVGFKNGSISGEPPPEMVEEVVSPVLTCLLDSDPRVRYYACESLYNVTKVAQASIMPKFEAVFDSLTRVVADNDASVRACAENLDREAKDIMLQQNNFDIKSFVPKLEEYIYTKNPFTRMFIINWISLLDSKFDLVDYLPSLLDGIFNCLYDTTDEIRASALVLLSELLNKIHARPAYKVDLSSLLNILLKHAQIDQGNPVQHTSIEWIRQFIRMMEGQELISFTPSILSAILPCLAFQHGDMSIASSGHHAISTSNQGNICQISAMVNSSLLELVTIFLSDRRNSSNLEPIAYDLSEILGELATQLQRLEHPVIKLAILDWLRALKKAEPDVSSSAIMPQKLFQTLLDSLSSKSDPVVRSVLRVITEVFCDDCAVEKQQQASEESQTHNKDEDQVETERKRTPSKIQTSQARTTPSSLSKKVAIATSDSSSTHSVPNISRFVQALCKTFRENELIFEERGTFIILNLCNMIKPEIVYKSFAETLKEEKSDLRFAYNLVQKLNQILLTTQPLFGLRSRLNCGDEDPETVALFNSLYVAWCHSPIATITLCLLTNNYKHANELVLALSQTEICVDTLTQIDWLVQLIESPIFASLRMRLIDVNSNQYLLQSLYGLLMILPQSEAYRRLSHRLNQVYKFVGAQSYLRYGSKQSPTSTSTTTSGGTAKEPKKATNLELSMKHFHHIQSLRAKTSRQIDYNE